MLASDVTTSASSEDPSNCSRTARCRRSSASLGACDMNGGEPLLEHGENRTRPEVLALIVGYRERFQEFSDRALEFRIVRRQVKRRAVELHRLGRPAATAVDVAEGAKGRQILRGALQDEVQFLLRVFEPTQMQERASEGHVCREVPGMAFKSPAAHLDRFFMPADAAALFGELRKSNRRRILFDPASKVFEAGVVRHAAAPAGRGYLALTMRVLNVLELWPASSVTPRTIVYEPGATYA